VTRWERYLAALEAHELGHRRFGLEAASAVERSLSSLIAEPTCQQLETAIAAAAETVVEQYRERERRYDEETKHGRADGARF
jgi:predicted secreted Zn-dependent protease